MTYIINHNSMHVIFNYNIYFNDIDASDNDADDDDDDDGDGDADADADSDASNLFTFSRVPLSIITFHNCIL